MHKTTWWKSLRIKIVAWSFVPTVIILSAVAWFTFYSYQKVLGDLAIKQFPLIVQPEVQAFTDTLTTLSNNNLLAIYKDQSSNPESSLEVRGQGIIDYATSLGVFDGGIFILDQHGIIIKTQPGYSEFLGQDWSNTIHFRTIIQSPNYVSYTELLPVKLTGKKIFCLGFAITGKTWEEFFGAGYYCFNVFPVVKNAFYEAIDKAGLGENFYVLDRNLQIVYSSDSSEIGKDLSKEPYIQQLSQGETKSGRFRIGDQDMVASYSPVLPATNRLGWNALVTQSWTEVMQPSLPYRQLLLVLLAIGVVVPVLVTVYGVRHITEPIQKLIRASEQVSAGQLKQRIEVKTGDEIETLAGQFNLMSAKLDKSYSSLEKKVADRTRELAIFNSIITVANQSLNVQEILEYALNETVEQMGFDAGAAFRFEPDPSSTHLMAYRGFEPATVSDFIGRYVITSQEIPVFPEELTIWGVGDFQDENLKEKLIKLQIPIAGLCSHVNKRARIGFLYSGEVRIG